MAGTWWFIIPSSTLSTYQSSEGVWTHGCLDERGHRYVTIGMSQDGLWIIKEGMVIVANM